MFQRKAKFIRCKGAAIQLLDQFRCPAARCLILRFKDRVAVDIFLTVVISDHNIQFAIASVGDHYGSRIDRGIPRHAFFVWCHLSDLISISHADVVLGKVNGVKVNDGRIFRISLISFSTIGLRLQDFTILIGVWAVDLCPSKVELACRRLATTEIHICRGYQTATGAISIVEHRVLHSIV